MIIVIISEPRSGSSNLALWFRNLGNIELLYEPISNPNMKWFKNDEPISEWKFDKDIIVIKETFNETTDYTELISIADKIIFLYRENYNEQLESFTHAMVSNNWDGVWLDADFDKSKVENFKSLFSDIKNRYREFRDIHPIGIEVSYEELYFKSKIENVIDYLELPKLKKYKFPINTKYRVKHEKRNLI